MTRKVRIREVWASNLDQEMRNLSHLIDTYHHIAVDTEFPGVLVRPIGQDNSTPYDTLRLNVDLLKIIQLGISLSTADGTTPDDVTTWQFNFAFSLSSDLYAQDSIDLLTSAGLDFAAHQRNGIDVLQFSELLISSGLVLNPQVTWISFAGAYDFCYLYKVLCDIPLPPSERDFFDMLHLFFPVFYDIKFLMLSSDDLHGGLNKVAELLACDRVGSVHQAGSDSLLTLDVFFRLRERHFRGVIELDKAGILFGLSAHPSMPRVLSPAFVVGDGKPTERRTLSAS